MILHLETCSVMSHPPGTPSRLRRWPAAQQYLPARTTAPTSHQPTLPLVIMYGLGIFKTYIHVAPLDTKWPDLQCKDNTSSILLQMPLLLLHIFLTTNTVVCPMALCGIMFCAYLENRRIIAPHNYLARPSSHYLASTVTTMYSTSTTEAVV